MEFVDSLFYINIPLSRTKLINGSQKSAWKCCAYFFSWRNNLEMKVKKKKKEKIVSVFVSVQDNFCLYVF